MILRFCLGNADLTGIFNLCILYEEDHDPFFITETLRVSPLLVQIPKAQLRKGMYVETVECPQAEFPMRRFLLVRDSDLQAILSTSAQHVVVNMAKGRFSKVAPSPAEETALRRRVRETVTKSVEEVRQHFDGVLDAGNFDLAALTPVVHRLLELAADAPAVFVEMTRLKSKDEATYLHSLAVGTLMAGVGRSLEHDEETVTLLGIAGMFHDIGKLLIPNEILNKTGTLTEEERREVRNHPEMGYELLSKLPGVPQMVLDVCRHHHESLDGSGYPLKLKGASLSPFVRIAPICDVFDALPSVRPYKRPWSSTAALSFMFERDSHFDRKLVLRFGATLANRDMASA